VNSPRITLNGPIFVGSSRSAVGAGNGTTIGRRSGDWQRVQTARRFSGASLPPRARGRRWSTLSAGAPQIWHVHRSRARIVRRSPLQAQRFVSMSDVPVRAGVGLGNRFGARRCGARGLPTLLTCAHRGEDVERCNVLAANQHRLDSSQIARPRAFDDCWFREKQVKIITLDACRGARDLT
jgi:hypothetical protein